MGRRKKEVIETPDTNDVIKTENNVDQSVDFSEMFLLKVLDKQFEIVNSPYKTDDLLKMDADQQTKIWENYTFTREQFIEWKQYFMNLAKETPMLDKLQDGELDEIFFALAGQWAFEVNEE